MERFLAETETTGCGEKVEFRGTKRAKYRVLAVFLICAGLLVAAFAVSSIWFTTPRGEAWLHGLGSFLKKEDADLLPSETETTGGSENATEEPPAEETIPEGAVAVVTQTLSASASADTIINETPYTPDLAELLSRDVSAAPEQIASGCPLVLVIHTHSNESYCGGETAYFRNVSAETFSEDVTKNVCAAGAALVETLNGQGIAAIHCTDVHTGENGSLQGSYRRAADTVTAYLERYPTIRFVIDLHRDAVLTAGGEYVRTVAGTQEGGTAQLMPVVGTDCNGTRHDAWEENLALALQLREKLNAETPDLCRPVCLRNSSYNQELAPRSLLVEVGTGANTKEEAVRAAVRLGQAFAELIQER